MKKEKYDFRFLPELSAYGISKMDASTELDRLHHFTANISASLFHSASPVLLAIRDTLLRVNSPNKQFGTADKPNCVQIKDQSSIKLPRNTQSAVYQTQAVPLTLKLII